MESPELLTESSGSTRSRRRGLKGGSRIASGSSSCRWPVQGIVSLIVSPSGTASRFVLAARRRGGGSLKSKSGVDLPGRSRTKKAGWRPHPSIKADQCVWRFHPRELRIEKVPDSNPIPTATSSIIESRCCMVRCVVQSIARHRRPRNLAHAIISARSLFVQATEHGCL